MLHSSDPESQILAPRIVLIGHIVKEMIHFPDRTLGPVLGGPVAYGSVVACRLGESVGIVTIIGTDMPDRLLTPLRQAGVDLTGLSALPGNYTTATELIYYPSGDKEIRYPHKAPPIRPEDVPACYGGARMVYVAVMDHDVPLETMRVLAQWPSQVAIDLGGYGGAHSREHPSLAERENPQKIRVLVSLVDIVRASVEDCRHLFGPASVASERQEEATVSRFVEWGAKLGVLTLGERGCVIATGAGVRRFTAAAGRVVDTTGAGDSFSTAFLVAYLRSGDVEWSARFGAAAVVHVIERSGGVHLERMPTLADVERRMYGM